MNAAVRWWRRATLWGAATLAAAGVRPAAAATVPPMPGEYEVKAAFLYNFIAFTEWPRRAFATPTSPFVIGVLGRDPFGPTLDAVMNGESFGTHGVVVRRFDQLNDVSHCHILFVSASEAYHLGAILRQLRSEPMLLVSDIPGFAEAGGAIGLITTTRVELAINPAAVRLADLAISAKLLQLAHLVEPKAPPP